MVIVAIQKQMALIDDEEKADDDEKAFCDDERAKNDEMLEQKKANCTPYYCPRSLPATTPNATLVRFRTFGGLFSAQNTSE